MKLSDFDYELPKELIAQRPCDRRDGARLLVVRRSSRTLEHRAFADLPGLLEPTDLVVVNDARVIPARLYGTKVGTGGRVELLLVRPAATDAGAAAALQKAVSAQPWICLGQASKGLKPGAEVMLDGGLGARIVESVGGGEYVVSFSIPDEAGDASLLQALERLGQMPLPPYIDREATAEDAQRYQTVYARSPGSVAAPTAGLHFTPEVLEALRERGNERVEVTLDVGPGTFLPVRVDDLSQHTMHPERYQVPPAAARTVNAARRAGRRVVAVGTTVVRTLESASDPRTGELREGHGETRLFIAPGYTFAQVDVLLTNFHLPRSTLLMLVSALLGLELARHAYAEAVRLEYRFFSYGDAMLVLP